MRRQERGPLFDTETGGKTASTDSGWTPFGSSILARKTAPKKEAKAVTKWCLKSENLQAPCLRFTRAYDRNQRPTHIGRPVQRYLQRQYPKLFCAPEHVGTCYKTKCPNAERHECQQSSAFHKPRIAAGINHMHQMVLKDPVSECLSMHPGQTAVPHSAALSPNE